jgi:hypothetical protein
VSVPTKVRSKGANLASLPPYSAGMLLFREFIRLIMKRTYILQWGTCPCPPILPHLCSPGSLGGTGVMTACLAELVTKGGCILCPIKYHTCQFSMLFRFMKWQNWKGWLIHSFPTFNLPILSVPTHILITYYNHSLHRMCSIGAFCHPVLPRSQGPSDTLGGRMWPVESLLQAS